MSSLCEPGNRPTISAVIPTTLRSEKELRRAVESVLSQTVAVDEVIVVVDVATPDVELPRFSSPRVRVVRNHGEHGPGAARMRGVCIASGDLVAWLDDDDTWTPERLAAQTQALAGCPKPEETIVAGRSQMQRNDGLVLTPDRPPRAGEKLADYLFPSPGFRRAPRRSLCTPSLLIPKRILVAQPLDTRLQRWEDYEWILRVVEAGNALIVVPTVTCVIDQRRASGASLSSQHRPDQDRRWAYEHLWRRSEDAYHVFMLTYVVPGLAGKGRRSDVLMALAAAARSGSSLALLAKGTLWGLLNEETRERLRQRVGRWRSGGVPVADAPAEALRQYR